MIPTPTVVRVPTCRICGVTDDLIRGDGPPVCRLCVRLQTRLALIARTDVQRDHEDREGAWPE